MAKWTKEEMRIIKVYKGMRERCYNSNCYGYKRYGARGIEVKFTKEEFVIWYKENVDNTIKPHAARVLKSGHYEFSNMHIVSSRINTQDTLEQSPAQETKDRNMRNANGARKVPVNVDNIQYDSIRQAAIKLGCDLRTIRAAIKKHGNKLSSYKETRTKFNNDGESK